jgi:amino acid permease
MFVGLTFFCMVLTAIVIDLFLKMPSKVQFDSELLIFEVNPYMFVTFAVTFMTFICQQYVFTIKKELDRPSREREDKIYDRTIIICMLAYILICSAGYLTFLSSTQALILTNYQGPFFLFGKLGLSLTLFCAIPLNFMGARNMVLENYPDNIKAYWAFTICFVFSSACVAMAIPNIT